METEKSAQKAEIANQAAKPSETEQIEPGDAAAETTDTGVTYRGPTGLEAEGQPPSSGRQRPLLSLNLPGDDPGPIPSSR